MFKIINATGGYGKTIIIRDVSIELKAGEIVGLLGRNGAGKTTLMKYAMGLIDASEGEVEINQKLTPKSATKRAQLGLGYVPQGRYVFPRMTVAENIAVAAASNGHNWRQSVAAAMQDFPILKPKADDLAASLSGGQQQILALARALATQPKILLLDEPTEGVQPSIIDEMAGVLKRINQQRNIAILVAEQNLDFCLSLANNAYIMEKGMVKMKISKNDLLANQQLQQELLGV